MLRLILILALAAGSLAACRSTPRPVEPAPPEYCPVSGNELGTRGEPVTVLYRGKSVRLCCEGCVPEFQNAPKEFIAKMTGE